MIDYVVPACSILATLSAFLLAVIELVPEERWMLCYTRRTARVVLILVMLLVGVAGIVADKVKSVRAADAAARTSAIKDVQVRYLAALDAPIERIFLRWRFEDVVDFDELVGSKLLVGLTPLVPPEEDFGMYVYDVELGGTTRTAGTNRDSLVSFKIQHRYLDSQTSMLFYYPDKDIKYIYVPLKWTKRHFKTLRDIHGARIWVSAQEELSSKVNTVSLIVDGWLVHDCTPSVRYVVRKGERLAFKPVLMGTLNLPNDDRLALGGEACMPNIGKRFEDPDCVDVYSPPLDYESIFMD